MTKFSKTYGGGTLRTLLFQYAGDRSKVDPAFKSEFDEAQAALRKARAAAAKARAEAMAKKVAA